MERREEKGEEKRGVKRGEEGRGREEECDTVARAREDDDVVYV